MNKFKLNKKAFTLTELIAVIVILSILVTLSVVIFMNIRNSVLQKEYDNLVVYLETKGVEYANDTHITTISVEDLIKEGYVKPDDESDIYDPRDRTSLNCYLVKMEFKDGEYVAKFGDNIGRNEDGTCKEYTKTSDFKICKVDNGTCVDIGDDEWFSDNITLGIKYRDIILDSDAIYSWLTNTGFTSKGKNVTTEVNLIGDITYKCEVKIKENDKEIIGTAVKNVRIDKEKPVISEIKVDTNWSTNKTIEVIANDGMGSGIDGYAFAKDNGVCREFNNKNKLNVFENGNYKICVKDKVGNISEVSNVSVSKIDKEYPKIRVKKENPEIYTGENYNVLNEYFEVTYPESGGVTTCNIESTGSLSAGKYTLTCTVTAGNGLKVSASTTLTVKVFIPSIPNVETRYVNASGNIYNGSWTNKTIYFDLSPGDSKDFVTSYQYKIGNGNWTTPSWLSMNGNKGSFTYTSEIENIIYVRACNSEMCSESSVGKSIKIDTTSPTCKLSVTASGISIGTKSSDVTKFGVNKSTTASYTNSNQSLSAGTFYGHVYDRAGNTGICSSEVVNATPLYNKTTTTCKETFTSNTTYTYDCSSSYDTCASGWTSCEWCNESKCKKSTGTVSKKYTATTKTCSRSVSSYTCRKSATNCSNYTLERTCKNAGCYWLAGGWNGSGCYGNSSFTIRYKCPSGAELNGSYCYKYKQSSCGSDFTASSTTYKYSWGTTRTNSVTSCSNNKIDCNMYNYNKTYTSCSEPSYTCSSGTYPNSGNLCYVYSSGSSYNGCSSGSDTGSGCYKSNVSSCPAGWSSSVNSSSTTNSYTYSASSSTSSNLATCTSSTEYNTCSGTYTSSQSSMKNKTNVSCSVGSYSCATGYSKVGTSYCYK